MSNVTKDLKDIVDRVAREGTLTPAAIKQFDEINTRLETTERELERLQASYKSLDAMRHDLAGKLDKANTDLTASNAAVTAYKAREFEFTLQQRLFTSEIERRQEMRGIVAEVFRNFETARQFSKSVPMPPQYQGGPMTQGYETQTETEAHVPQGQHR